MCSDPKKIVERFGPKPYFVRYKPVTNKLEHVGKGKTPDRPELGRGTTRQFARQVTDEARDTALGDRTGRRNAREYDHNE